MDFPIIDFKKTGSNIKQLCRQQKYSPTDIKNHLRLSCVQTVYKWFQGENIPSIENFYALSMLLEVSMEDLIVLKKPKANRARPLREQIFVEQCPRELCRERMILYWNRLQKIAV